MDTVISKSRPYCRKNADRVLPSGSGTLRWFCFFFLPILLPLSGMLHAQPSNQITRVQPNEVSAMVGSAVNWSKSLTDALEESKKTGKPVFWYISSVPGTFMDRKVEIDRYMLGGPFSWPPIIEILNDHFVPLKVVPRRKQTKLGVRPYEFVEPGFLVLKPDATVFEKVDRITTFQYDWMQNLLARILARLKRNVPASKTLKYFDKFSGDPADWIDPYGKDFKKNAANLLLSGMIAFRQGNHQVAKDRWREAVNSEPESPLAWKASLEAQGLGPFYRGFEIHRNLPEKALLAGTSSAGSAAPKETYDKNELWSRSVDFMLGMQRKDGAFVDTQYDFGGTDSLPNVYIAVTSLVGMSLLKSYERFPRKANAIKRAILKIEQFVTDESNMNHADRDEILWACAYRLRFLSRIAQHAEFQQLIPDLQKKRATAVKALENIQLKTGNWYHEYNNPFVTATALVALHEARQAGGLVDDQKIERGIKSLLLDRQENGTYPYYSVRKKKSKKSAKQKKSMLASSAGRMPVCELALVKWQQKNQADLVAAVSNSLKEHRHLESGYKYDDHTSNMAYGGFFFWYDMRSRSEAIRAVDSPQRLDFWKQQQEIILNLPEVDGCFVDSHELGRCYGTAMAILSLE